MLLQITTTHQPATDLGYLLHKHPARHQTFNLAFGRAHVFYPEASPTRCTAALLLDIEPVGLVRGKSWRANRPDFALDHYVNDRPYVASSFFSTAIVQVYRTALNGRCKDRPQLVETPIPLQARLSVLPSPGGAQTLHNLFEPLGYDVQAEGYLLDPHFPEWGASRYFTLTLAGTIQLSTLLTHLYVLIPVLDAEKHYYIGQDEVEKLLSRGEGWLADHPEREFITRRYLLRRHSLVRAALDRLADDARDDDAEQVVQNLEEEQIEKPLSLHEQRLSAVEDALVACRATRVLDLGCGEGKLLTRLLANRHFTEIVGVDISHRALEIAARRLRLERMPPVQRARIRLHHGALTYRDSRLYGYDAAALVEVIEHLDPYRLHALARAVFAFARPSTVIITTPNREYNVRFESLPAGRLRHRDHRFEWTRAECQAWAEQVAEQHGYVVSFYPIGPEDAEVGPPTQMIRFTRADEAAYGN